MIPLVRPLAPDMTLVARILEQSVASGVWSNFGAIHEAAIEELNKITDRHCVLTTSGTSAIDVALRSLKFLQDKKFRVLVPDYTHSGTLQAIVNSGNTPVLAPVRTDNWQLDLEYAAESVELFDVMIVVSPFGMKVDTGKYDAFAFQYSKLIVYDFAGAWGQFPDTKFPVCYSFHATKTFNAGEGGLVTCEKESLAARTFKFTNFCTNPDRSIDNIRGYNFKIDEIKSAVVLAQSKRHELMLGMIKQKKDLYLRYYDALRGIVTDQRHYFTDGSPSLCVFGGFGKNAPEIERRAREDGIVIKQYYPLLSTMPALQSLERIWKSPPAYFSGCLALPSDVDAGEFDWVVELIKTACSNSVCGGD